MKKIKLFCFIATFAVLSKVSAQVSSLGNNSPLLPPAPFVGWDGTGFGGPRNLDIKNNYAALDVRFFTNQTGVTGTSVQRMVIKGSGATAGFVGIGTVAPSSNLTIDVTPSATGEVFRTDCANGNSTFWRMQRGGLEYGKFWNTSVTIPFWGGGVAAQQAYTPFDFILDAPRGSFIVQAWSRNLSGTNVLKEIFRTTTGGTMTDYNLTPVS